MAEEIYLDPADVPIVTHGRTQLRLDPFISSAGIDWGDAAVQNYFAQQAVGSSPVAYDVPNRQIRIPLSIRSMGGTSFDTARGLIQAKAGLWQGQGGWLKRVTSAGTVWADIVSAQLHLGGGWLQANASADTDAVLTLEAIPDFYEAEETLSDHTETTAPEIRFTETTVNGGDFPLGDRVRIVVDDDSANNQRAMFWAFRGRHYSSAVTAASAYDAESLSPLDTAAVAAKVGASSGQVVTHSSLSTNWTPVVGTNIGGGTSTAGTFLTNTGTNRLYARVFTTSGTAVQVRSVYDVGDLVNPVENDAVRCYDGGTFHILDLGELRLDPPPTGTHRWQGMIQAKGEWGGESFSVDRIWIANQDESAGVLQAPFTVAQGLSTFSARSEFNTESGALNGDSLAVGGVWATSGAATDFSAGSGVATRTTTSDASTRFAVVDVNMTATVARIDFKWSVTTVPVIGLLARVVTLGSDYLDLGITGSSAPTLTLQKAVASAGTTLYSTPVTLTADQFHTLQIAVMANGAWQISFGPQGATRVIATGSDSALVTGGTLATGDVGFYDRNASVTACTRTFDNFAAWAPTADAVVFASQSAELNTAQIVREDVGGTAYGPVSYVYGDLPRIPNRSSAGTVEFMGKLSRGDLQTAPDPGIDDLSTRVYRRPSYLTIPS